jgi:hypothetical protein
MSKQTDLAMEQLKKPLQPMPTAAYDVRYYTLAMQYLDRAGITDKLSENDKQTFFMMCARNRLDPTLGEIYPILRAGKLTIVTNYLIYFRRANETGLVDGMDETVFDGDVYYKEIEKEYDNWVNGQREGKIKKKVMVIDRFKSSLSCRVTIYRKDAKHPFSTRLFLREFAPEEPGIWVEKTYYMLEKCAMAINYRRAFQGVPEMESLPYMEEEITNDPGKGNRQPIIIDQDPPAADESKDDPLKKLRDDCNNGLTALSDMVYDDYNIPTRRDESQKNHLKGESIDTSTDATALKAYAVYLRCRWFQGMITKRGEDLNWESTAPIYEKVKDMVKKRELQLLRDTYNNLKGE